MSAIGSSTAPLEQAMLDFLDACMNQSVSSSSSSRSVDVSITTLPSTALDSLPGLVSLYVPDFNGLTKSKA